MTLLDKRMYQWKEEVPTGAINGVNTSFTLSGTPKDNASLFLFLDAVPQIQGTDYTISGATITMTVAPVTDSQLLAHYRKA